jgi:hypothetical protein
MTVVIALLVIPFIPDYPLSTKRWWITHEHQVLAVSHIILIHGRFAKGIVTL